MSKVSKAEAFWPGAMGSLGKADNMFIRQFRFPDQWDPDKDILFSADSDRLLQWDYDGFRKTLKKHIRTGEGAIGSLLREKNEDGSWVMSDEQVMAFIVEALKADKEVEWTGWRVTGTVNRSNGFPVYHLQLFANRSGVEVYSDEDAPNVCSETISWGLGSFFGANW